MGKISTKRKNKQLIVMAFAFITMIVTSFAILYSSNERLLTGVNSPSYRNEEFNVNVVETTKEVSRSDLMKINTKLKYWVAPRIDYDLLLSLESFGYHFDASNPTNLLGIENIDESKISYSDDFRKAYIDLGTIKAVKAQDLDDLYQEIEMPIEISLKNASYDKSEVSIGYRLYAKQSLHTEDLDWEFIWSNY